MDYVKPPDIAKSMVAAGAMKCGLPPKTLVLRGMLAGAYLGVATSMAVTACGASKVFVNCEDLR